MSFASELKAFAVKVETTERAVFQSTVLGALNSVKFGSPVTGAPGQPVDTENLRAAWYADVRGNIGVVACNVQGGKGEDTTGYAEIIEEGQFTARSGQVTGGTMQKIHFRSPVGGAHSVKLTKAGLDKLLAQAAAEQGVR